MRGELNSVRSLVTTRLVLVAGRASSAWQIVRAFLNEAAPKVSRAGILEMPGFLRCRCAEPEVSRRRRRSMAKADPWRRQHAEAAKSFGRNP
jgi:hypothetical protein